MFYAALLERLRSFGIHGTARHAKTMPGRYRLGQSLLRGESLEDRRLLSVTLFSHPSTSYFGQSVELVAKVTPTTGSIATGDSVTFWLGTPGGSGNTSLGTTSTFSRRGAAEISTSALPVTPTGTTDSIFAVYNPTGGGTADTSNTIQDTVNQAPTHVAILPSSKPAVAGTSVAFTAVVTVGGHCGWDNAGGTATPPAGTLSFSITTTDSSGTHTTTVAGTFAGTTGGKALFTAPPTSLSSSATQVAVTATFTPTDATDYQGSSQNFTEQVVPAPTTGETVDSGGTQTLRGGQRTISFSSTTNTASYSDTAKGVSFTNGTVTSIVYSSNGHQAELSGTATVTVGTTTITGANFTMLVDSGAGRWYSKPSVSILITGGDGTTGLDYKSFGSFASGTTITLTGTGTTKIPPLGGNVHDFALHSLLGEWGGFGFGGRHAGWRF